MFGLFVFSFCGPVLIRGSILVQSYVSVRVIQLIMMKAFSWDQYNFTVHNQLLCKSNAG